jgi:hypothetical protein
MVTTPAQQWQRHQHDKGNNASTMRAMALVHLWQQCQRNKGNNATAMRAITSVQLQQQIQRNEGNKDAIATMPKMH